jgi:hypothetical protein
MADKRLNASGLKRRFHVNSLPNANERAVRVYSRYSDLKIQGCLFMGFGMLLPPKLKRERRHVSKDGPGSMNSGVAARTE